MGRPAPRILVLWRWKRDSVGISVARCASTVVVHCRGGLGRSGMFAASVLVALGRPARKAIEAVREAREGTIETPDQEDRVRWFEMELGARGGSREGKGE